VGFRKAETDVRQTVQFSTQRDGLTHHMQPSGFLERIDEDKSSVNHSTLLKRNTVGANILGDSLARSDNLMMSVKNGDFKDVLIHSNKLDESVKAPERLPIRITGLTDFLTDQHHSRIGVYKREVKCLHNFWKTHVSVVYKEVRDS
jgi:hypothetical protein